MADTVRTLRTEELSCGPCDVDRSLVGWGTAGVETGGFGAEMEEVEELETAEATPGVGGVGDCGDSANGSLIEDDGASFREG